MNEERELSYRKAKPVKYHKLKELRCNCPTCNRRLKLQSTRYKFCPECGQKLDWNVEEQL